LDLAIDVTTAAKRMQNGRAVEANLRSTQGQYVTGDAMIAIIMLPPEARIELVSARNSPRALATASRLIRWQQRLSISSEAGVDARCAGNDPLQFLRDVGSDCSIKRTRMCGHTVCRNFPARLN
jgi:hypothetical protein